MDSEMGAFEPSGFVPIGEKETGAAGGALGAFFATGASTCCSVVVKKRALDGRRKVGGSEAEVVATRASVAARRSGFERSCDQAPCCRSLSSASAEHPEKLWMTKRGGSRFER